MKVFYNLVKLANKLDGKQLHREADQIDLLLKIATFDPSIVSTTSSNIGSIKIDTKLDVSKIKNALKKLQDNDFQAFAKARDFDFIISDISAKEAGMDAGSGRVAWFDPSIPDVCFMVKSYVDVASEEDVARTIIHEAQHGRYPGYGEWTAENAEKINF